jgi:predicted enzyme related to lactoylglutathione lyase
MSRVVHFELPAADPSRAERFYAAVFGWKFTEWERARTSTGSSRPARAARASPGVGWLAYCRDPEGNPFGLMQADAEAK